MTVKVLVTFSDEVWDTIEKDVMPKVGGGDSEVVRTLVLAYLEDKGFLLKSKARATNNEVIKELATQEIMIGALVQLLQEKGLISFEDWENRVSNQVE